MWHPGLLLGMSHQFFTRQSDLQDVTLDGEPLDPAAPFTLLLHKPVGYVVTSPEDKNISGASTIYDLLPYRCDPYCVSVRMCVCVVEPS